MKYIYLFLLIIFNSLTVFSQEFDTIPMQTVFINNFCLGDNINQLEKVFGKPTEIKYNVIDNAVENTEPSKNIYFYDSNFFSEPYEVSKGKIGEFNIRSDSYNMKLIIIMSNDTLVFKIGDRLNLNDIEEYFPSSIECSRNYFSESKIKNGYAFITLKLSQQDEYFEYPYLLINSLNLSYKDSTLSSITTNYYKE